MLTTRTCLLALAWCQLHRDLYQFLPGNGGRWKSADNNITETSPDGTVVVRFETVSAFLTPGAR